MKRIIIALVLLAGFQIADAQTDTIPGYQKNPKIPTFSNFMIVPDSVKFGNESLKKNMPVMIMIFSPDCSHCKIATEELIKHMDLFKNVQIVMASPMDFINIKKFYEDYKIPTYPNITMGRDGTYSFGTFYKVKSYPSIYLYDKKGDFVKAFQGDIKWETIAESL